MAGSVRDRVRKLLALARSSNEHEAASAAEHARALMAAHGLTADDVADTLFEVADAQSDEYRVFAARLASALWGCAFLVSRAGELGFRGELGSVRRALALYRRTVEVAEAQATTMVPIAPWLQEDSRKVWRFFWWDGFAQAIYERAPSVKDAPLTRVEDAAVATVDPAREQARQEAEARFEAQATAQVVDVLAEVRQKATKLSANINVYWLRDEAHRNGRGVGLTIMLGEAGEMLGP